ncbi:hypothetical protein [Vogesella oryzae]|uniref:hypothetical protein n=1 Tax=Vogesella oryzae TaxID=1735285 RepID=UPI0015830553|nr:hypothetical protein [Vogesella oryzae]
MRQLPRQRWIRQRKTGTALRIEITGQLFNVLNRITTEQSLANHGKVRSLQLVQNGQGQPLGKSALHYRFNRACKAGGIEDFGFVTGEARRRRIAKKCRASATHGVG